MSNDIMKDFPLDRLSASLDQMHGVLNALYLCRDDNSDEFNCSDRIVVETLDAVMEILEQAKAASDELHEKHAAAAAAREVARGK